MTWQKLCTLNIKQSQTLEYCARTEAKNNAALTHLQLQRDELVDHYLRSQKLALCALTSYQRRALSKAISRWRAACRSNYEEKIKLYIQNKLDEFAVKKQEEFQIQEMNRKLQSENDELASFSQEGYIVAKNAVTLSDQVEEQRAEIDTLDIRIEDLLEKNRMYKIELGKLEYSHKEFVGRKNGVTIPGTPNIKVQSNKK